MIVSARDPHGVAPFEVGGLPGVFPCPLEEWLASTGLTEDALEAHKDAVIVHHAKKPPASGAHLASAESAAHIGAAVTRKKAS